jgi:hypothetical protein
MALATANKQVLARMYSMLEWAKGGLPYHATVVLPDGKVLTSPCTSLEAAAWVVSEGTYWLVRRCHGPRAGQFVDHLELDPLIARVKAGL